MATPAVDESQPVEVKAKKWNCVAVWSWNVQADTCAICRESLTDLCINCKANQEQSCPINFGQCNHAYHQHCIMKWLDNKPEKGCPADGHPWVTTEIREA